jgi:hypothetical protein
MQQCDLTCWLQGTLRQWAPVGALLSLMWVMPCISQGVPVAHALPCALATWLLSCCLAAGLEMWQRTSYIHRKQSHGVKQGGNVTSSAGISKPQGGLLRSSPTGSKKDN